MKDESKKYLRILSLIFASILFLSCFLYIDRILAILKEVFSAFYPFLMGLAIAFILNLPLNFFEKKVFARFNHPKYKFWNKIKRGLCIVFSSIIIVAVLALVFSFVIPEFIQTAKNFVIALPDYMDSLNHTINNLLDQFHLPFEFNYTLINWDVVSKYLLDALNQNSSMITAGTLDTIIGIFKGLFNMVLGVAFAIYILASKESLSKFCKRILFATMKRAKAEKVLSVVTMSSKVFAGFVSGQCIEVLIIGCLCLTGMLIFNMPYAVMISCVIAITAFIPVFGALIGTAIGAFMILLDDPIRAIWFVIFIIILQQLESNIIYPKVMGKSVGLPGIWVLLAVTVGGSLFGIPGMLLSVPCFSVLYCLLEAWLNKRLTHRKICTHTFIDQTEPDKTTVTVKTKAYHSSNSESETDKKD